MLAELMAHLTEQEERDTVRRSLARAAARGIGPFKKGGRAATGISSGGGRAASTDFIHEAPPPSWRLGSAFDFAQQKSEGLLACPLTPPVLKEVHGLIGSTARDLPAFRVHFNNTSIYLSCNIPDKQGHRHCSFDIQNETNTFWMENTYGNNMSRSAAVFLIDAIERILEDDAIVDTLIAKENQWRTSFLTRELVRARCAETLDVLRGALPDSGPVKFSPRPTDKDREEWKRYKDHSWTYHNYTIPEKPYADAKTEVLSLPHFPITDSTNVTAHYGAFRLQRDGVIKWVQFTNIDGSQAADFIVVHPRNSDGNQEIENMGREEAEATLKLIDAELPADHPARAANVLDRLATHAATIESKKYLRIKIIDIYNSIFQSPTP